MESSPPLNGCLDVEMAVEVLVPPPSGYEGDIILFSDIVVMCPCNLEVASV